LSWLESSEITLLLEVMNQCAFYLAGNDQMGLQELVEIQLGITMDEYNPEQRYEDCMDALVDAVGTYNFSVSESNLNEPLIDIVVNEEQTAQLESGSEYQILDVVPRH